MVRTRASARLAGKTPNEGLVESTPAAVPSIPPPRQRTKPSKRVQDCINTPRSALLIPPVPTVATVAPTPIPPAPNAIAGPSYRNPAPVIPPPYDSRQYQPVPPWRVAPQPRPINHLHMQYLYEACKVAGNNYPIHPDVRFRRLPFYQFIAEVMKPSSLVPTSGSRTQEATFYFHLTPQQAQDIMNGPDMNSTQVQLRFCLLETSCEQDDCFPPSCSVKINNKVCQLPMPIPTNKTGVEPKRPPGPVNITALLKVSATVANAVAVTWAADFVCRYAVTVALVRKLTSVQLLNRLINKGTKNSDFTRSLIKEKLREDLDSEIATTSLRVSLVCPLGKMRMICPCRPTSCLHLQCFDASLFLQMNERKPTWVCPVCDKSAVYDSLLVDGYFQDVLNSPRLAKDCSEIQLHKDGSWSAHLKKELIQEDFFNDTNSNIEIINDDLDVIPLSDGSESSTGLPALKRPATSTTAEPDVPQRSTAVVDLTSDSEDDLPLKRKIVAERVFTPPSSPPLDATSYTSTMTVPVTFAESVKARLGHVDDEIAVSQTLNEVDNGTLGGLPILTKAMAKQTSLKDYFKKRLAMEAAARELESFPVSPGHSGGMLGQLQQAVSSIISLDSPSPPGSPLPSSPLPCSPLVVSPRPSSPVAPVAPPQAVVAPYQPEPEPESAPMEIPDTPPDPPTSPPENISD